MTAPTRGPMVVDSFVALGCALAAAALGFALANLGGRFPGPAGPAVVVILPLLPVLALGVLADPRVGLAAVVAAFPIGTIDVPGVQLQVVQLAVVAVVALIALRRLGAGLGPLPWTSTTAWAVALPVWLVIALPSAPDRQRALRELVLFTVAVLFAAAVVAACRRTRDVQLFMAGLVAMVAVVAALTPFGLSDISSRFGGAVVIGRATGIFGQPNELGMFCATGALLALGLVFAAHTRRGRMIAIAAAAACVVGLLLSLSRGSWIGFVLGVGVLLVKVPEARRALVVAGIPLVAFAVVVGAFAPTSPQVEIVGERLKSISGERNPYDDRPTIWREALREIGADPLSGQGPGNFPVVSSKATSESRTTFAAHAHNVFLTWGAENGLPFIAIAVGLAVHLGLLSRRAARRRGSRALAAGCAAALVAVLGQGIVDYPLRNAVLFIEVWGIVGALVALSVVSERA